MNQTRYKGVRDHIKKKKFKRKLKRLQPNRNKIINIFQSVMALSIAYVYPSIQDVLLIIASIYVINKFKK